jgi:7,8-dihydropterin-6-yl-methyl-4-(beta-D-ribofuranosyl)aminobenzene 5'-phosphate synthase
METATGRLTILADNVVPGKSELIGESGFSVLLETESGSFLFDTGRGNSFVHNGLMLGKDLGSINKVVLSHNHSDHTGGLPYALKLARQKPIKVYGHEDIFLQRFRKQSEREVYLGIPFRRGHLERLGADFVLNTTYQQIESGIFLSGMVPRRSSFESSDLEGRFLTRNGKSEPDTIPDDQSLIIHTGRGLLVVTGCAHSGVINVVNHALESSGNRDLFALVGGTHLGPAGENQQIESIAALKDFGIGLLAPAHCTGQAMIHRMKNEFQDRCHYAHVGWSLEF